MNSRLGTLIAVCLIISLNAASAEWKPYVGIGGVTKTIKRSWSFNWDYPPDFAIGANFEAGLKYKHWEVYTGYQQTDTGVDRYYAGASFEVVDNDSMRVSVYRQNNSLKSWREQCGRIGIRRGLTPENYPVRAILGTAFVFGEATYYHFYRHSEQITTTTYENQLVRSYEVEEHPLYEYSSSQKHTLLGGIIEVGINWQISTHFDIQSLLQAQLYYLRNIPRFKFTYWSDQISFSNQIQIRYTL
jgi:hypothetical protein